MRLKNTLSKTILASIFIMSSSSLLDARGLVNMNAIKTLSVHGGYSSGDVQGTSVSGANIGFEIGKNFMEEKIHGAFGFDYDDLGINTETSSSKSALATMYLTLGYKFFPDLNTYILGGVSTIDGASGLAYGAGVKYQLINYLAIDARYKHATLTPTSTTGSDLNVNTATVFLELNFQTNK